MTATGAARTAHDHAKAPATPLVVKFPPFVGRTATRYMLSDGVHVVGHMAGEHGHAFTCVGSACVEKKRYFNCCHIEAVLAYEAEHAGELD